MSLTAKVFRKFLTPKNVQEKFLEDLFPEHT